MNDLLKKYIGKTRPAFHEKNLGSIVLWKFDRAVKGTRVYFSTRYGGVSEPPYKSLNLGFHVGDDPTRVSRNRELLAGYFGFSPGQLTSPRQRHTNVVMELSRERDTGAGAGGEESPRNPFDPCDGLVTALKQRPLLLHFADCVPIVITAVSGGQPLVAVLHAGRVGLMDGVIASGVARLRKTRAAARGIDRFAAAIGPSVGPCCYEVDEATADGFAARFGADTVAGNRLDLREAARRDLKRAGIGGESVFTLDHCTCCDQYEYVYYSYRRDGGVTGRQGALAWIE